MKEKKERKENNLLYFDVLLDSVIVQNEFLKHNDFNDFDAQSKTDVFKNVFMIIQFKYFHDSWNIAVILAPGREFFSAKCDEFSITFTE